MKKLMLVALCVFMASPVFAGLGLKVSPVYGVLLSPEFTGIDDIAGSEVKTGGAGVSVQYLTGVSKLGFGAEVSYLPMVNLKYDYLIGGNSCTTELEVQAIPVLGIVSLELPLPGKLNPYIQGGAGLVAVMEKAKANIPAIGLSGSESETEAAYCVMVGGGVLFKIAPLLAFDVSLKYYNMGLEFEDADEGKVSSVMTIGAGLYIRM